MLRTILLGIVLATIGVPSVASEHFSDVPNDHWAAQSVEALAEKGIMKGYPGGDYRGDRPVTRYELAAALERFVIYMREALKQIEPPKATPAPTQPESEKAKPADPVTFLKSGGFLTEDSVLLQKDTTKPVTTDQLAQALATVAAKLVEENVPSREEEAAR